MPIGEAVLGDNNCGEALSMAPIAFETPRELREADLAACAAGDFARIAAARMATPPAEKPEQPFRFCGVADAVDWSDAPSDHLPQSKVVFLICSYYRVAHRSSYRQADAFDGRKETAGASFRRARRLS